MTDDNNNSAENGQGTNGTDSSVSSQEELKKAKSDFLYLAAEFENYKKNTIKERSELIKYGAERLLREILEVSDNFSRALSMDVSSESLQQFKSGVVLIDKELKSVLQRFGLSEIDPLGKPFDPAVCEALSSEETADYEEGHISRVFRKAYKLHDRIIRPAQVVVARAPQKSQDAAETSGGEE